MFQDAITLKNRHDEFIKKVTANEVVYGLKSEDGYATSSSTKYEDDNGTPIGLICFWSEKERAKSCAKKEWREYKVVEIPLTEFIESWCIGMANDGLYIGTQFDQNLFGYEIEPLGLILEIISELKYVKKDMNFRKFEGMEDLEKQINEIK